MQVRLMDGFKVFNTPDGTRDMSGPELVQEALRESDDRFDTLTEIVGRLLDRVPEDQRLYVLGCWKLVEAR